MKSSIIVLSKERNTIYAQTETQTDNMQTHKAPLQVENGWNKIKLHTALPVYRIGCKEFPTSHNDCLTSDIKDSLRICRVHVKNPFFPC